VCLLAAAVALRTDKSIRNHLSVFERGESLLQNGKLHFLFRLNQSWIALEKGAWHLNG